MQYVRKVKEWSNLGEDIVVGWKTLNCDFTIQKKHWQNFKLEIPG